MNQNGTPRINYAIRAVGSVSELARRIKVSRQAIYGFRKRGVPVEFVPAIVAACNGQVTVAQLRPDLARALEKR